MKEERSPYNLLGRDTTMHYDSTAIPDAEVPPAIEPVFQHIIATYASEVNKTVGVWRAVPDDLLDFKPHDKTHPIRTIFVHQLLSERRFFAQFSEGGPKAWFAI